MSALRNGRLRVSCFILAIVSMVVAMYLLSRAVGPLLMAYWLLSEEKHSLPGGAIQTLFESAGVRVEIEGESEVVSALCSISEGAHCWYEGDKPSLDFSREASRAIVDGIGMKEIERTPDNIAYVRCRRPKTAPDEVQCEVKLWSEWYPIPVE